MNDTKSWFERGHVALVTGASKGFGFAVAQELAARGISLTITARDERELSRAADDLRVHVPVEAIAGDVRDAAHVHRLIDHVRRRFGRLDLLVNNASSIGRSPMPHVADISPANFEDVFDTNVYAPIHTIGHALALLIESGGTIVNVTSDAAVNAYSGWGLYGSSKAALEHISRTLAQELDGFGVSVIVADPGNMDTALHRAAEPGEDLRGLATPQDVAPALLRVLAGEREPFVRVELQSAPVSA